DAAGNQTALVDLVGIRTSFVFDALNRVFEQDDPLNAKTTLAYDAAGRETSQTDRLGRRKDFSFDKADRLTGATWRDARGGAGTQTRYSALAGTTKVGESDSTYDNPGRLTNLQIKDGAGGLLSNYTYTYDLASRATSETIDGTTTNFGYDTVDQLTSAGASNY